MAKWGERNCQSLETAARGFEPGFSQLKVWRFNRQTTAPRITGYGPILSNVQESMSSKCACILLIAIKCKNMTCYEQVNDNMLLKQSVCFFFVIITIISSSGGRVPLSPHWCLSTSLQVPCPIGLQCSFSTFFFTDRFGATHFPFQIGLPYQSRQAIPVFYLSGYMSCPIIPSSDM